MAIQTQQTANLFELACADTRVTYSTTSITGTPRFSYSGSMGDHQFAGDEIETLRTALGTEVTVTLEAIPDLHTITLTLVVPDVLTTQGGEESLSTVGIFTTNHTTIAGPPPVVQTYEIIALHGLAKLVAF